jgi:subtilisin family serine protease
MINRSFLPMPLAAVIFIQWLLLPAAIVSGAASFMVPRGLMQKAQQQGTVRVIVRLYTPPTTEADIESDLEIASRRRSIDFARASTRASLSRLPHRVIHEFQDFPFMALSLTPGGLQALESLRGVVTEVLADQLNAPFLAESIPLVQADQAWAGGFAGLSLDGTGTVIAILDTGVDKGHSFLSGKVIAEACFSSNDSNLSATSVCPGGAETSTVTGSGVPCSANGCDHGTHVAGIAAGGSAAGFAGVAPGAGIMAIQVFSQFADAFICQLSGDPPPCALAFTSDILAGLQHVYSQRSLFNIAAVNISLGGQSFTTPCNTDPRARVIKSLKTANIATVVASGNEGEGSRISAPACAPDAVSVGSTGDGSGGATVDEVSFFTNSATFLSLLAPGSVINSSIPGGGFAAFSGTSMAAPHVSGAFAILKQAAPNATVSQMLAALQSSGQPVFDPLNGLTKPRIRILDALAQLPAVQFSAPTYTVDESNRRTTITVNRSGVAVGTLTVNYAISAGTATSGSDFTARTGRLRFTASQTTKTFTVSIKNDTISEADETVNLALSDPVGGLLGSQSTAILTVTDNDAPGVIQFGAASYTVGEAGRRATITVTRTGGSASGAGVTYATSDGTATAGSDYTATSGTLTFAANQTSKTFIVPVTNNSLVEGSETINLTLSNPTGGAALGAQDIAVLTTSDND